ncbi:MAG: class I SAM-dependent methyltransferase [Pseudomonadota bacterium]
MLRFARSFTAKLLYFGPEPLRRLVKEQSELLYWRNNLRRSDFCFYNGHFEKYFSTLFGLERSYFSGKRMLDIGCGPLGSLEWADNAKKRVGVDPLADKYLQLNGGKHRMTYVHAKSECLPFRDESFDVVSMFNALDHVEDVDTSISEAVRVLAPGGDVLLIVEVNHPPTLTEPHCLTETILNRFSGCTLVERKRYAVNAEHNVYGSIREAVSPAHPNDPAILCARLVKQ